VSCTGRSALRQALREPGNMWHQRTQVGHARVAEASCSVPYGRR
jgi:hypothetical protein